MWKFIVGFWAFVALLAVLHGVVGALPNFGLSDLTVGCMPDEKGFFASFCDFFNGFLVENDGDFLNVLVIVGIILLTILIPVAIFVFNNKRDFKVLDLNVILDHVIDARYFLVYLSLVYVPLLFWAGSSYPFRVAEVIVWFVGVCFLGKILFKSYRWMKEERSELRYEYLKNLNYQKEMSENWNSVWKVENIDGYSEKQFFTIFASVMDKLLRGDVEKIKIALGLIDNFNSFIDKRSSAILVIFEENFLKILEWHFFIWQKTYQPRNEKNKNILGFYNMLLMSLSSTLKKIEERELKENAFYFFAAFQLHVEKHKKDFVKIEQDGKKYYADEIMPDFFDALIKNIENYENGEKIWGDFPDEWKITSENIKKRENYVSKALHTKFIRWTRLSSSKYNKTLNDVAYNLFPHVSLIMWGNILTFLMSGWEKSRHRMTALIVTPPIFSDTGQTAAGGMGDDEEAEKKRQAEEEETISLALLLFGDYFTQDYLKNYITEIKELEGIYDSGDSMEYSRKDYVDIFEKLREARRKKDAEK